MKSGLEFCLICQGPFSEVNDARRALEEPFIENFVEETGRLRHHDVANIQVAAGIVLGDLELAMIGEDLFEISFRNSPLIMKRHKAEKLAEELRRQAIFDDINVEPLGEYDPSE